MRARGLGLASISYDPPDTIAAFARARSITFPMLADPGSATIRRFGILNPVPEMAFGPDKDDPKVKELVQTYVSVVGPSARMAGIALPGTFILDREGRVTSRFFEDFYVERATMANLMLRVGAAAKPVAATRASTAHLDVTAYASDAAVSVGNRFALVLDVTPRRGIHVYAPGAKGYRTMALDMAPHPFVRIDPTRYPASEVYHFKPLDERVPVYQKPFRLVREAVIGGHPQAQAALRGKESLTLSGTLEYQACDDRICFNPVTLPLSWTVALRALLREPTVVPRAQ